MLNQWVTIWKTSLDMVVKTKESTCTKKTEHSIQLFISHKVTLKYTVKLQLHYKKLFDYTFIYM